MAQQRILVIDSAQVEVWRAHGGHLAFESRHANTEDGHATFDRYVRAHAKCRYYLLTDVVEEGFQFEAIPAVSGADRKALITRRQAQYFYGSPLTAAISLGRDSGGRRDERVLFAALTRPAIFEPWLAILRKGEAQVTGLWSTPLLAPALVRAIAPNVRRALLVTLGRGGIRQTYVEDGKLRFSRLAPAPGTSAGDMATACEAESSKIYQYLAGQRIVPRGSVLPVLVLVHATHRGVFDRHLRSSDELEFVATDIQRAAEAIGQRDPQPDSFATSLFAHALLRNPPQEQFAPPDEQRFDLLGRIRIGLMGIGGLALAGCLVFAGKQMLETMTLRNQNEVTTAQASADLVRYQNLLAALPPMPASATELRSLVGRYREIERASASPAPLFGEISRAMDAMPQIEVDRIDWSISDTPDPQPATPEAHGLLAGLEKPGTTYAVATVAGRLAGNVSSSQRAQIEAVNAFAEELGRNEGLLVTVVRMPVDVESQRALRSDAGSGSDVPRFAVRVARKLG